MAKLGYFVWDIDRKWHQRVKTKNMSQDRLSEMSRTWLGRDAGAQVVCVFAWRMPVRHLSDWEHAQASLSESRADCALLEHDFHPHQVQLRRHTFFPCYCSYVADSGGMSESLLNLNWVYCTAPRLLVDLHLNVGLKESSSRDRKLIIVVSICFVFSQVHSLWSGWERQRQQRL